METPKNLKITVDEVKQLQEHLRSNSLSEQERELLCQVLNFFLWIRNAYEEKTNTIQRFLKKIFGPKTEKRPRQNDSNDDDDKNKEDPPSGLSGGGASAPSEPSSDSDSLGSQSASTSISASVSTPAKNEANGKVQVLGHGRHGADEYTGAKEVLCSHKDLKSGERCPLCGKGKIHRTEPGIFLQILGEPFLQAIKYSQEQYRCNLCGFTSKADLPAGVPSVKWTFSARTVATLLKYGYGFPQKRQESFLKDHGLPISDSVLYEQSEQVALAVTPVALELERMAANSEQVMHIDDTRGKILALDKERSKDTSASQSSAIAATGRAGTKSVTPQSAFLVKPEPGGQKNSNKSLEERIGTYTTAIIARTREGYPIYLFKTGRKNAGEKLDDILAKRDPNQPIPSVMCDGSSMNYPEVYQAIILNCLTHGRRQFIDIEESFPSEASIVIDLIGKVYANDAVTKKAGMDDHARLAYHQKHSGPIMEDLYKKLNEYQKSSEPNSGVGKAIKYVLKRWDRLTQFLHFPCIPLDNNKAERVIKRFVLYRKNSYFFVTERSAELGNRLQSVFHTLVANGINPFDYFNKVQEFRMTVQRKPEQWLPWNYLDTLKSLVPNTF